MKKSQNGRKILKKRKNEKKIDKKEKDKEKRKYTLRFIGEIGRSGFEIGQEHVREFENYDEIRHLLYHKDIIMSEIIRSTFRSAGGGSYSHRCKTEKRSEIN